VICYVLVLVIRIQHEGKLIEEKYANRTPVSITVKCEQIKLIQWKMIYVEYNYTSEIYNGQESVLIDWYGLGYKKRFPEVH